jgi:hypothetical protein
MGYSEAVNRRKTENTMVKTKTDNLQKLHRKVKIGHYEPG